MNRINNKLLPAILSVLLAAIASSGCSDNEKSLVEKSGPVQFERHDECHVCGMIITRFPGPKGQAVTEKNQQVLKFCSTRDMFSWLLQPENIHRDHSLYVHDMAQTSWEHPKDTALIDARKAFYVIGSHRTGAMGPTLATFARRADADAFAGEQGGVVINFSQVTLDHLSTDMAMHDGH